MAEVTFTAVDTSVLVPAFLEWHADHERARRALDRALGEPPLLVAQHTLVETYSVLTRLPAPHRLSPATALGLLRETLEGAVELSTLPAGETWRFLTALREEEIAGGATYDAVIARTVARAGAGRILTLNQRHFERVAPDGLDVVEP